MTQRDFTLQFVTTADTSGAEAAASAVSKVGDAASGSGDKLADFEAEWKERMDALKAKLDEAQEGLRESGEKGGEAAGEGMGEGLNLAANLHLVQQAMAIGTAIGGMLGQALVAAYDGSADDLKTSVLASLGVWSAQVDAELSKQQETLPAKYREINAKILREYKEFWDDYLGAKPQTTGEWLDELAKKADFAALKLKGLNEVHAAAYKIGKSQIEQDFQDKKQDIMFSDDPESVKARKLATAEKEKREEEAALRASQRQQEAAAIEQSLLDKEAQFNKVQNKELEQERRAKAYSEAKGMADREIEGRKQSGQQMTAEDENATRDMFFKGVGRRHGITDLSPERDETAELARLKKERENADRDLVKARLDAEAKKQTLELEGAGDASNTAREQARADREAERRATLAQRKEMEEAEKARIAREADDAAHKLPPPIPALPGPGQEQTPADSTGDLQGQLTKAAQNTNNSSFKMDLEAAKRALQDGGSAEELKEVASLLQRAALDNNDAVRQVAASARQALEKQQSSLEALKQEMAALRSMVESRATHS